MIETDGKKELGKSVGTVRHDDEDDIYISAWAGCDTRSVFKRSIYSVIHINLSFNIRINNKYCNFVFGRKMEGFFFTSEVSSVFFFFFI